MSTRPVTSLRARGAMPTRPGRRGVPRRSPPRPATAARAPVRDPRGPSPSSSAGSATAIVASAPRRGDRRVPRVRAGGVAPPRRFQPPRGSVRRPVPHPLRQRRPHRVLVPGPLRVHESGPPAHPAASMRGIEDDGRGGARGKVPWVACARVSRRRKTSRREQSENGSGA